MENQNPKESNRIIIPKLFYDSLSDSPFTNCLMCNRHLLMNPTTYIIEKAFRKNPAFTKPGPIFEYAMCLDCARKLSENFSKKSTLNIQNYFADNFNYQKCLEMMLAPEYDTNIELFLKNCIIKGTPVEELTEYQYVGYFYGQYLMGDDPPFMISGIVADEILSILSEQTLEELDDFTGKYLTGPPEFSDFLRAPKRKPVVLF